MKIEGSFTAIVTPFTKSGTLDEEGLRRNVDFQASKKITGIVPVGTTGESPTVSETEHERIIEVSVDQARKKMLVVAGTGSNSTSEALHYTKYAKDAGADAALVVAPYYNRPTQQGLIAHYTELSKVDLPIIIYNIPSRTGVNMEPETIAKLAEECSNIVGLKDAAGSLDQLSKEVSLLPKDFTILSGDDSLTVPMMSIGAKGVISVASNIVPAEVVQMVNHALAGRFDKAREAHYRLLPLMKTLFVETNPVPVKAAMQMLGMPAGDPRLPLVPLSEPSRQKLELALRNFGVLK